VSDELGTGSELERRLERAEPRFYDALYAAAPAELREARGLALERDGELRRMTLTGFDHPLWNRVGGLGLSSPVTPLLLDELAEHYRGSGVRRFMLQLLPHVLDARVESGCRERGLVPLRGWAKHLGPALDPSRPPSAEATDLRIERIGPERAAEWAAIELVGFELPDWLEPWLAATVGRSRFEHLLAFDGDRPVAAALVFLDPPIAQLGFGATLPEARGRGAQSALVLRRLELAAAAGCPWVATETDEELPDRPNPSYHNQVRLGLPVRYVRANWGPPKPSTPS